MSKNYLKSVALKRLSVCNIEEMTIYQLSNCLPPIRESLRLLATAITYSDLLQADRYFIGSIRTLTYVFFDDFDLEQYFTKQFDRLFYLAYFKLYNPSED